MKKKKLIIINQILPKLLKEKGVTAKVVSRETGVSQSTLSTWGLPSAKPRNVADVAAVADFFEVSLNYLLFGEIDEPSDLEQVNGEIVLSGVYRLKLEKLIIPSKRKK